MFRSLSGHGLSGTGRTGSSGLPHLGWMVAAGLGLVGWGMALPVAAQQPGNPDDVYPDRYQGIEANLWLDRGDDPVVDRGDRLRIYYSVSEDAYTAVFHIDTDGHVRLLFPHDPDQAHRLRGGRDYRLLFDGSSYWRVNEHPGRGYFFIVASATPLSFADLRYSVYDRDWDLSFIASEVYQDPYLAMDDFVASMVPDWEYGDYGLDVAEYSVGRRYDYPRFMCYDCHGYRPYTAWNPYYAACTSFRVVIWDDPFFYPYYYGGVYAGVRYRADRVVYNGRRFRDRPRFEFKERGDSESSQPLVLPRTNPGESAPRRRTTGGGVVTAPSRGGSIVDVPDEGGARAAARRRTGEAGATNVTDGTVRRTTPAVRPSTPSATGARPVLERRPRGDAAARARPSDSARPPAARGTQGTGSSGRGSVTRGRVIRPGDATRGSATRGRVIRPRSGDGSDGSADARGSVLRLPPRSQSARPPSANRPGNTGRSRGSVRIPSRSGGAVTPGARSGGSSRGTTVRVPSRSGRTGGAVTRPPTRPPTRSGGAVSRPPPRSGGGSARASSGSRGSSSAGARVRRPRGGG